MSNASTLLYKKKNNIKKQYEIYIQKKVSNNLINRNVNNQLFQCLIFTLPMRYATFVNQSQSLELYFQDRYL